MAAKGCKSIYTHVFIVFSIWLLVMITCGVTIVKEYVHSQNLLETKCMIKAVEITNIQCEICTSISRHNNQRHRKCLSGYKPCVKVSVTYTANGGFYGNKYNAMLHPNDLQLQDYPKVHCTETSHSCYHSEVKATQTVIEKITKYTKMKGDPIKCYFHPTDYENVALRKRFSESSIFHTIFWPTLLMIFILVVIGVLHYAASLRRDLGTENSGCCKKFLCKVFRRNHSASLYNSHNHQDNIQVAIISNPYGMARLASPPSYEEIMVPYSFRQHIHVNQNNRHPSHGAIGPSSPHSAQINSAFDPEELQKIYMDRLAKNKSPPPCYDDIDKVEEFVSGEESFLDTSGLPTYEMATVLLRQNSVN